MGASGVVYYVEDDKNIRELTVYALGQGGIEARGCANDAEFRRACAERTPDAVLLDIMLPDADGLEILARIRRMPGLSNVPVMMLTAKDTELDKVRALDGGADDYLSKPFGMMEMVSRIRAVLRRTAPAAAPGLLQMGNLRMDSASHTVYAGDTRVELTLKEFELLKLFLEHPGRVFTRDQLLERIWSTDYVGETRTVDVHIGTLRTKLGQCGEYIRTVRGVGYRMEA